MCNDSSDKILWAPWRSKYFEVLKKTDYKDNCFLCNRKKNIGISDQSDEFMIIDRGKYSFVMLNAWPYNPYHLLIAPYEHIGDIEMLHREVVYEIMDFVIKFKHIITQITNAKDFNIGCNLGAAAGAGVAGHMHMHLVPRWIGDTGFMSVVSDTKIISNSLQNVSKILKEYL